MGTQSLSLSLSMLGEETVQPSFIHVSSRCRQKSSLTRRKLTWEAWGTNCVASVIDILSDDSTFEPAEIRWGALSEGSLVSFDAGFELWLAVSISNAP
jgi:hypothetical protein